MADEINVKLPFPPRCKPDPASHSKAQEALVITTDGRNLTGSLRRYDEYSNEILFRDFKQDEDISIPITEIKSIELSNSRQFIPDQTATLIKETAIALPTERQEFELDFLDGSNSLGETLGYITDHHGLHLFIAQAFYNYHHFFVPFKSMKNYRIGPQLGEMLIEKEGLSEDDVNRGLIAQNEMRAKKIGEYLAQHKIVDIQQLENALKRQQEVPNLKLGEALVQEQVITEEALEKALEEQKLNRGIPLGEILVNLGLTTSDLITRTLANKLGIPFVDLRKYPVETAALNLLDEKVARKNSVMPLAIINNKLVVAIEDPLNRNILEDLRFHTHHFIEPVIASKVDIEWAINQHFGLNIDRLAMELRIDEPEEIEDTNEELSESDNTLVRLVNKMILDAHEQGASDIHIEPYGGKNKTIIRFRKDGTLIPYVELPPTYRFALVSRIKIMCDLDISERRKPQDGKIDFKKFGPARIELRVATIPTAGGVEDVVMRVLANGEPAKLENLQFSPENLAAINKVVTNPYGLFLVSGPTGSGKTTTLHSILKILNTPEKKIWTAEDPIEITQRGLRQLQVNPKIGLSFANAMRSFLRADPDIIMVGEMRDEETAKIGIEASLTGHIVFSTLHTNSAVESIVRLLDMGMDPYNFADALLGVLAQRLAKRLCNHCKEAHKASDEELNALLEEYYSETNHCINPDQFNSEQKRLDTLEKWKQQFCERDGNIRLFDAKGCEECGHSGYSGRIALHELLLATPAIKEQVHDRATVAEVLSTAFKAGMKTLKQDGIEKVLQGYTDIHQVHAVCIK